MLHTWEMKNVQNNFQIEKSEEKDHLIDPNIDGSIILR